MKKIKSVKNLLNVFLFFAIALASVIGAVSCSSETGTDETPEIIPSVQEKYKCANCKTEYASEAEKNNCAKQSGCPKYVAPQNPPSSGNETSNTELSSLSSIQFAEKMCVGWNLGNTFDSAEYGNKTNKGENYETAWGMPKTTQAMINAVADKGFKTIRIPISWHNHITNGTNLTIDSKWLARVKEVVDWAIAKDMFVIINIHHDNLTSSEMNSTYGFSVNNKASENAASKNYIEKIWTQVANYFKNYDEHLIFELLNEPRDRDGNNNGFDASSLSGGATLADINAIIAQYNQVALNAIRATGGLNANRFVMAPYYAAQPWSSTGWSVPTDTATDKVLIAVHAYDPYKFAMGDMSDTDFDESVEGAELSNLFNNCLKSKWTSKGRGVVMGEASCTDKHNLSDRLAWFESYISKAKSIKCPVILWDNMEVNDSEDDDVAECHGYFNRNDLTWYFPTLVEKMITTAGGTAGSENSSSTENNGRELLTQNLSLASESWADGIQLDGAEFTNGISKLVVDYEKLNGATYSSIKLSYWDSEGECSISGTVTGNVIKSTTDTNYDLHFENNNGTLTLIPDAKGIQELKEKGVKVYGYGAILTSIKIFK